MLYIYVQSTISLAFSVDKNIAPHKEEIEIPTRVKWPWHVLFQPPNEWGDSKKCQAKWPPKGRILKYFIPIIIPTLILLYSYRRRHNHIQLFSSQNNNFWRAGNIKETFKRPFVILLTTGLIEWRLPLPLEVKIRATHASAKERGGSCSLVTSYVNPDDWDNNLIKDERKEWKNQEENANCRQGGGVMPSFAKKDMRLSSMNQVHWHTSIVKHCAQIIKPFNSAGKQLLFLRGNQASHTRPQASNNNTIITIVGLTNR